MRQVCRDKEEISTKRSHKRRKGIKVMPKYAPVDMTRSLSTTPCGSLSTAWAPLCLMSSKAANVSMEVTTENLSTLFDIVQTQIARTYPKLQPSTPARSIRRRESDDHYKKGSPGSRQYWVNSKGWVDCHKPPKSTPGSGSGSTDAKRRRFTKANVSSPKRNQKVMRRPSMSQLPGDTSAAERVLARDVDSSTETFGGGNSSGGEE